MLERGLQEFSLYGPVRLRINECAAVQDADMTEILMLERFVFIRL
jgi:hypothetical protein